MNTKMKQGKKFGISGGIVVLIIIGIMVVSGVYAAAKSSGVWICEDAHYQANGKKVTAILIIPEDGESEGTWTYYDAETGEVLEVKPVWIHTRGLSIDYSKEEWTKQDLYRQLYYKLFRDEIWTNPSKLNDPDVYTRVTEFGESQ